MKKRYMVVKKAFMGLAVVMLGVVIMTGAFFGIKGYRMYRSAISEMSIEDRVNEIRSRDHFTRFCNMPVFYIHAVISAEDRRFEEHGGIDPVAVGRALWTDIRTMSFAEGGSTITQQVAKNMLFTKEKKIERKVAECFAAYALEAKYTKHEIFELYVNTAYFGSGRYGIYDASEGYFGKKPSELTEYEAAMLAGLPNAPSVYSPDTNPELAAERTAQVLESMVQNHILKRWEAESILEGTK